MISNGIEAAQRAGGASHGQALLPKLVLGVKFADETEVVPSEPGRALPAIASA
jgi:hypothetical protein